MVAWLLAFAAGRDGHHLLRCERVSLRIGIVASIGSDGVKIERDEQRLSLGHFMEFTLSHDEL